jgi:hypothetical protein
MAASADEKEAMCNIAGDRPAKKQDIVRLRTPIDAAITGGHE